MSSYTRKAPRHSLVTRRRLALEYKRERRRSRRLLALLRGLLDWIEELET